MLSPLLGFCGKFGWFCLQARCLRIAVEDAGRESFRPGKGSCGVRLWA